MTRNERENPMTYFTIVATTVEEFGGVTNREPRTRYNDRAEALAAAIDLGQEIAGPVREGYRRPTVAVVRDEDRGLAVQVGNADVDAEYTVIYPVEWQPAAVAKLPDGTGLGHLRGRKASVR
ncbi:hypothetical protein PBI_LESEDI_86 [Mycobacterium phage Lesedi]|uniref:Uncharacterized protein n=1 Tax=Mycobacterium phage Lesedi TaxID=2922211 RepID=G1D3N2_9CAUD|nr:hypothetical protein FGG26_gp86 [Mycobacterium phage Lesedi]AEK09382.1 hypothetical protein PBI_LESEDI_86 [Mycobacterium phage Lesedi]